jgi:hypothetical protein
MLVEFILKKVIIIFYNIQLVVGGGRICLCISFSVISTNKINLNDMTLIIRILISESIRESD